MGCRGGGGAASAWCGAGLLCPPQRPPTPAPPAPPPPERQAAPTQTQAHTHAHTHQPVAVRGDEREHGGLRRGRHPEEGHALGGAQPLVAVGCVIVAADGWNAERDGALWVVGGGAGVGGAWAQRCWAGDWELPAWLAARPRTHHTPAQPTPPTPPPAVGHAPACAPSTSVLTPRRRAMAQSSRTGRCIGGKEAMWSSTARRSRRVAARQQGGAREGGRRCTEGQRQQGWGAGGEAPPAARSDPQFHPHARHMRPRTLAYRGPPQSAPAAGGGLPAHPAGAGPAPLPHAELRTCMHAGGRAGGQGGGVWRRRGDGSSEWARAAAAIGRTS